MSVIFRALALVRLPILARTTPLASGGAPEILSRASRISWRCAASLGGSAAPPRASRLAGGLSVDTIRPGGVGGGALEVEDVGGDGAVVGGAEDGDAAGGLDDFDAEGVGDGGEVGVGRDLRR